MWMLCGPPEEGACGHPPSEVKNMSLRLGALLTKSREAAFKECLAPKAADKRAWVKEHQHMSAEEAGRRRQIEEQAKKMRAGK